MFTYNLCIFWSSASYLINLAKYDVSLMKLLSVFIVQIMYLYHCGYSFKHLFNTLCFHSFWISLCNLFVDITYFYNIFTCFYCCTHFVLYTPIYYVEITPFCWHKYISTHKFFTSYLKISIFKQKRELIICYKKVKFYGSLCLACNVGCFINICNLKKISDFCFLQLHLIELLQET